MFRRRRIVDQSNRAQILIANALVNLDGDTLVKSGSSVINFPNQGTGGSDYDLDTPVGTGANLRESISDAMLTYGASGDNASSPDSAAASITGDIDLRARAALDDWTPTANQTIIGKYNTTGNQRAYFFYVNTSGRLVLTTSSDGSATITYTSTAAPTVSDGQALSVRAALDVDNGSSNSECTFYTTVDGGEEAQLGSAVLQAVTSIFDSTAELQIGAAANNNRMAGSVFTAEIYNGIDGTLAVDFNAADYVNRTSDTEFNVPVGPQLVTNGDFSDGTTGWNAGNGATLAVVDGELEITADGANTPFASRAISTVIGEAYVISCTARVGTGNNCYFDISGIGSSQSNTTSPTNVQLSGTFVATSTSHTIEVFTLGATSPGDTVYFDNISCKQGQAWTLQGNTFIQNTGHDVVHSIGSAGLESTAGQSIASPGTVFMVCRISGTPPEDWYILDTRSIIASTWNFRTDESNADKFTIHQGNALLSLDEAFDNNPHVWTGQFNSDTTTKLTVSEVGNKSGDVGSNDFDYGMIFARRDGANTMQGYIAQLIVFDYALSENDITAVQNYLASKYAL